MSQDDYNPTTYDLIKDHLLSPRRWEKPPTPRPSGTPLRTSTAVVKRISTWCLDLQCWALTVMWEIYCRKLRERQPIEEHLFPLTDDDPKRLWDEREEVTRMYQRNLDDVRGSTIHPKTRHDYWRRAFPTERRTIDEDKLWNPKKGKRYSYKHMANVNRSVAYIADLWSAYVRMNKIDLYWLWWNEIERRACIREFNWPGKGVHVRPEPCDMAEPTNATWKTMKVLQTGPPKPKPQRKVRAKKAPKQLRRTSPGPHHIPVPDRCPCYRESGFTQVDRRQVSEVWYDGTRLRTPSAAIDCEICAGTGRRPQCQTCKGMGQEPVILDIGAPCVICGGTGLVLPSHVSPCREADCEGGLVSGTVIKCDTCSGQGWNRRGFLDRLLGRNR